MTNFISMLIFFLSQENQVTGPNMGTIQKWSTVQRVPGMSVRP